MKIELPPKEYYESLSKTPSASAALLRNADGNFLILKQTYKDGWHLPGGMLNEHETPRQAVIREVQEELGITLHFSPKLFAIDAILGNPYDRMIYLFDCGTIDKKIAQKIKIDLNEVTNYKFATKKEMLEIMSPKHIKRLGSSFEAFEKGNCIYLENGERVI